MKPRRFVRMFKPRFARLVESGQKKQTVRPTPARMPVPGDVMDAREWSGMPYRSKQKKLVESEIYAVEPITIFNNYQIELKGIFLHIHDAEGFAIADGFEDIDDLLIWFATEHTLPFTGIVIYWK